MATTKAVISRQASSTALNIFRPAEGLEERFAQRIESERAARKGGTLWPSLKVSGARFVYMDKPIGDVVEGVILGVLNDHRFYTTEYDPDSITSPDCAAIGQHEKTMTPDPKSKAPQAETCAVCPNNGWGSDPRGGRGKACSQRLRVIFLPWDGDRKTLLKA